MKLEVCVDSIPAAIRAYHSGADLIELCAHLHKDGLTPTVESYLVLKKQIDIPIKIMIRIWNTDFVYDHSQLIVMRRSVESFIAAGAQDFVFGSLSSDRMIDLESIDFIFKDIHYSTLTFHKAIDRTVDILKACEKLKLSSVPITHVLSSGGMSSAMEGITQLNIMKSILEPSITLIPAGKITHENLLSIHNKIGSAHYHGRRIVDF